MRKTAYELRISDWISDVWSSDLWLTRNLHRFLIALLVLALFGGAVILTTFVAIPTDNRDSIIELVGGINARAGLVIGFYFGRSEGSRVGNECVSTCRSRWSPYHENKTISDKIVIHNGNRE